MSHIKATVEHPGAHEPAAETFGADLGHAITKALKADDLKRGDGDYKITGYVQTSGVSTVYDVELATEPSATAKKDEPVKFDPATAGPGKLERSK